MTYQKAQEEIKRKIAKQIDAQAVEMMKVYEEAYEQVLAELNKVYSKFLRTTDPDDYYDIMIRYGKYDKLLVEIQALYNQANKKVFNLIKKSSVFAMTNNYNLERFLMNYIRPEYGMMPLDKNLIELTVKSTEKSWKKIEKFVKKRYNKTHFIPQRGTLSNLLFNNKNIEIAKIKASVTQAFLQGKTYKQLRNDIFDIFETTKYKAFRIAVTEGNRCANAGSYANMVDAANFGIDIKKFWMARKIKSRDAHITLHNKYNQDNAILVDDYFEIGGHKALYPLNFGVPSLDIWCKCTTGTKVGDKNPVQLERGINPVTGKYEVFSIKDYDKWAKDNGIAV